MSPDRAQIVFAADVEFRKLLARRSDVNLIDAALELARDAYPQLDFGPTRRWIDSRVEELSATVARLRCERAALHSVAECLAGRHGLGGDEDCYGRAESSFLHRVIETTRGIPVSLSLLYLAVAEKLGLDVYAVAAPAHFLLGCRTTAGPLFLDAFSGGILRNAEETIRWLGELSGWPKDQIARSLRPALPRQVVVRMLNNLKGVYVQGEEWEPAWRVQQRLTALHPGDYGRHRELAVVALKANRLRCACQLLDDCLRRCPESERSGLQALYRQACAQIAVCN